MKSSRAVAVLCCALILFAAGVQAQSPKSATPAVLGSGVQEWTYSYDATGNVKQIANTSAGTVDKYAYDAVGRVIAATTDGNQQTFSYDRFGNRLTAARVGTATPCLGNTECGGPLDIDSTTNRLGSTAAVHDDAGSIIRLNSISEFFYDALGMLRRSVISGTDEREYIYTADDERIAVRRASVTDWTIRHLDGKPLREFRETGLEGMVWSTDHIWRSGQLLATVSRPDSGAPAVTYHYHLDHLGTPRLITDAAGVEVARHSYYAFGPELQITPHESPELRLKFTGHERDLIPGNANTLDYMHARYYSATMGRFLSVDPTWESADLGKPQSWNRYAYVLNNPVNLTDPDGKCPFCVGVLVELAEDFITDGSPTGSSADLPKDPAERAAYIKAATGTVGVVAYQVGTVDKLRAASSPRDKIDVHHAPQAKPAGQVIPKYDPAKAPGIALPQGEHKAIPTQKGTYTGTARDLLAKDVRDLRKHTDAPNFALKKLVKLVRETFPDALRKIF